MKVILRNQGREVELRGRRRVRELLAELHVLPETVLVIRGPDLLTVDEVVGDEDVVELRPVISGGAPVTRTTPPGPAGGAVAWRIVPGGRP